MFYFKELLQESHEWTDTFTDKDNCTCKEVFREISCGTQRNPIIKSKSEMLQEQLRELSAIYY